MNARMIALAIVLSIAALVAAAWPSSSNPDCGRVDYDGQLDAWVNSEGDPVALAPAEDSHMVLVEGCDQ